MRKDAAARLKATQANKLAWDASAAHHLAGAYWAELQADVVKPGFSCLDDTITSALQSLDIKGKSLVQVCCNNGRETLSLAALGAQKCLGIDQSEAFIAQANSLAALAGSDCSFVCSDIYQLPDTIRRDFDAALITIGVLNWMPDLPRFFDQVAGLLKPGGALVIYETHPFLEMVEPRSDDPFRLVHSYFKETPFVDTDPIVYDGNYQGEVSPSYWFLHNIGEVLNATLKAGFAIKGFTEFPHSNREVDYDQYEDQVAQMPLSYLLMARK